jgi:hypothetical protein
VLHSPRAQLLTASSMAWVGGQLYVGDEMSGDVRRGFSSRRAVLQSTGVLLGSIGLLSLQTPGAAHAAEPSTSAVPRGAWQPDTMYVVNDIIVVRTGAHAGTWRCILDHLGSGSFSGADAGEWEHWASKPGDYVARGGRLSVGAELHPNDFVKVASAHESSAGMTIWLQKVAGDSQDLNIDGGILVRHGKQYANTPGYADTLQLYSLAGSSGLVLGSNDFVGEKVVPYAPSLESVANGHIRFELGPLWPSSEKMRLLNRGDLIVGWRHVRTSEASQTGTIVTNFGADFQADDVGRYVCWGDRTEGRVSDADRILNVLDQTTVEVETSREIQRQRVRVQEPATVMTRTGSLGLGAWPHTAAGVGRSLLIRDRDLPPQLVLDSGTAQFRVEVNRDAGTGGASLELQSFGNLSFATNALTRMQVDGNGNVLLRNTSRPPAYAPTVGVNLYAEAGMLKARGPSQSAVLLGRPTWTGIGDFANGWGASGDAEFNSLQYSLSGDGCVSLRGRVRAGVSGQLAWRMPFGFRPTKSVQLLAVSGTTSPRAVSVVIAPTGEVRISGSLDGTVSMDGLSYFLG